jgi:hypothetical protein
VADQEGSMTDDSARAATSPPAGDAPMDAAGAPAPAAGFRINEDWAATIFGLALLILVLAGVLTLDWLP